VKVIEKWRSRDLAQCKLQPEKLNATSTFHSIDENGFYLKYGVQGLAPVVNIFQILLFLIKGTLRGYSDQFSHYFVEFGYSPSGLNCPI